MEEPIIVCPHCGEYVIIESLNCGIFRHLVKLDFTQISPHASQEECINTPGYGCRMPFQVIVKDGKMVAQVCGWI